MNNLSLFSVGKTARIVHGDSLEVMRGLAPDSVHAMVTDPPSSIGFMGCEWDSDKGGRDLWIAWLASVMQHALAALKPGAYALVWALPKTSHWTAMGLEDAGFEIHDVHHHIHGEGMPKMGDVGKLIDKVRETSARTSGQARVTYQVSQSNGRQDLTGRRRSGRRSVWEVD